MEASHARQAVVIRVGSRTLAIPIEHVVETLRPVPIAPRRADGETPTSASVLGLAEIRGAACRVIDLARRLGVGTQDAAPPRRFVVVRAAIGPVALQVADVLDVAALGDGPPLARELAPALLAGDGLEGVLRDARWIEDDRVDDDRSGLHGAAGAAEPHDVP